MTDRIRLTRGVHRRIDQLPDEWARAAALLTACPDQSLVAGLSAARLYGLWLPDRSDEPFEVVLRGRVAVPESGSGCKRSELMGRRRHLHPDDVTMVNGVPIVSMARAWVDSADRLSLPDLVACGDSVLRSGVGLAEIDEVLGRARRVRGVVRARQARGLLDARSRSRPETHMRVAIVSSGQPAPDLVNTAVFSAGGEWLFEPDLGYREVRLAIEYKGADHATVTRMRKDMTRTVDGFVRGDWHVVEFGPTEVFQRPDQLAFVVRRLRSVRPVFAA